MLQNGMTAQQWNIIVEIDDDDCFNSIWIYYMALVYLKMVKMLYFMCYIYIYISIMARYIYMVYLCVLYIYCHNKNVLILICSLSKLMYSIKIDGVTEVFFKLFQENGDIQILLLKSIDLLSDNEY
jgi:hypothetical protein